MVKLGSFTAEPQAAKRIFALVATFLWLCMGGRGLVCTHTV